MAVKKYYDGLGEPITVGLAVVGLASSLGLFGGDKEPPTWQHKAETVAGQSFIKLQNNKLGIAVNIPYRKEEDSRKDRIAYELGVAVGALRIKAMSAGITPSYFSIEEALDVLKNDGGIKLSLVGLFLKRDGSSITKALTMPTGSIFSNMLKKNESSKITNTLKSLGEFTNEEIAHYLNSENGRALFPQYTVIPEQKKAQQVAKKKAGVGFVAATLLLLAVGGTYYYNRNQKPHG